VLKSNLIYFAPITVENILI